MSGRSQAKSHRGFRFSFVHSLEKKMNTFILPSLFSELKICTIYDSLPISESVFHRLYGKKLHKMILFITKYFFVRQF